MSRPNTLHLDQLTKFQGRAIQVQAPTRRGTSARPFQMGEALSLTVNALATLSYWNGVFWTNAILNEEPVAVALFENAEFSNIDGKTQLIYFSRKGEKYA